MYYDQNTIIYFNGEFSKAAETKIDLYSQSLHYGYAVFEGIRAYPSGTGTNIFKAKEHYDRLRHSAEIMQIPLPYTTDQLIDLTYEVLEKNNFTDAYIRPLVFCSPNMGLTSAKKTFLTIQSWNWTNGYLSNKMRVMTSSYARPNPNAFHIEAKVSGHYVNSIMACQEAKAKGFDEALLLDQNGFVAEGPGANVFYEKAGVIYTPPKGHILPGITRATIIDICLELNIPVEEKLFTTEELKTADSAFYCGTAAEVVALESLDNVSFQLKWEDSLGYVLQQAYKNLVLGRSILDFNDVAIKEWENLELGNFENKISQFPNSKISK